MLTTTEKLAMKFADIMTSNSEQVAYALTLLESVNDEGAKKHKNKVNKYAKDITERYGLEKLKDIIEEHFGADNTEEFVEHEIYNMNVSYPEDTVDSSDYLCVKEIAEKINKTLGLT